MLYGGEFKEEEERERRRDEGKLECSFVRIKDERTNNSICANYSVCMHASIFMCKESLSHPASCRNAIPSHATSSTATPNPTSLH
jgi:hypothetical protein